MVELKPYTRKVARGYNKVRRANLTLSENGMPKPDMWSLEEAKDYIVRELAGKSQSEIDKMSPEEFDGLYEKCIKHAWLDKEDEASKN